MIERSSASNMRTGDRPDTPDGEGGSNRWKGRATGTGWGPHKQVFFLMGQIFDLFGDPVPENKGRRGRPQHVSTQENRNKVNMLLAMGRSNERIANALNVTVPTLRKHYFSELKFRDSARDRLDAKLAMTLWGQFQAGNTGAGREFIRLLERNDMAFGLRGTATPAPTADAEKAEKLGKKERADREAQTAHKGTDWGTLLQ